MYCPGESAARCAVTNPSIFPLSHDWCWGPQLWLLEGRFCALVLCVSVWNGSRYLSGFCASYW